MKASPKSNPCQVVVHHKGDLHIARAGIGKTSETASSTSAGLYAAQAAVRKYFGQRAHVTLDLKQNGDGCRNIPSIYIATAKKGAASRRSLRPGPMASMWSATSGPVTRVSMAGGC
jgi:hypothetical protein